MGAFTLPGVPGTPAPGLFAAPDARGRRCAYQQTADGKVRPVVGGRVVRVVVAEWADGRLCIKGNGQARDGRAHPALEALGMDPDGCRVDWSGPCGCCGGPVGDLRGHQCQCAACKTAGKTDRETAGETASGLSVEAAR